MSKVVLRALDLIGDHLRTHKSGGGADAPLDLAKQVVQQRMDNPAPAAPPAAEKGNTTQGSVFAKKKEFVLPEIRRSSDDPHEVADANFEYNKVHGPALVPIEKLSGGVNLSHPDQRRRIDALKEHISHPEHGHISRLIVDTEGNVVEGQHRFEALKELGAKHVPVHIIEDIARGVDEGALKKAIKEAGPLNGSDYVNGIAKNALEALADSGSIDKVREEYNEPRGYEPHWNAALNYLESIGKSEGGDVEGFNKGGGKTTQGSVFSTNHIIGPSEMQGPKMPEFEGEDHPKWIPQRLPVYKAGRTPNSNDRLKVDMDTLRSTPGLYNKQADTIKKYVNFPAHLQGASNDEAMEYFINHVKENLLALHDHVAPEVRQRSKLWYDGARKITDDWSQKYNLPDHSVAGALAALSPQTDWFANVSRAERVLDAMKGNGQMAVKPHGLDDFYNQFKFSPEMDQRFKSVDKKGSPYSLNKPKYAPIYDRLQGSSLGDLDKISDIPPKEKAFMKAMWIRLYDEAHNDPSHKLVTPEGNFEGKVLTDKGLTSGAGWGSLEEISKAVRSVEEANNPKEISGLMGVKHKVRNFYNNIVSPNSKHGDVTMDTHAIAAALLRPLSGSSLEVAHNLDTGIVGQPGAGGSDVTGIRGTYPIFAEAYRRAAKERDLLPREMQSITWEAVRSLFPRTWKRAKNVSAVDDIWDQYRNGHIDRNNARSKIFELTGATHGIKPPSWFGQSAGKPNASAENSGNQGNVSGIIPHGAGSGPIASGIRRGSPQSNSPTPQGSQEELARGGTAKAHPASIIPGVHIVGHNPIFHGDE